MTRKDDVRAAGEPADVEAKAQAVAMERRADEALGRGVMAADGGHDAGAGGGGGQEGQVPNRPNSKVCEEPRHRFQNATPRLAAESSATLHIQSYECLHHRSTPRPNASTSSLPACARNQGRALLKMEIKIHLSEVTTSCIACPLCPGRSALTRYPRKAGSVAFMLASEYH
jgi:hypothetical protein